MKVTRGDLTPEQFRGLGQIMREFTGGYARTTVQQNLVLRWVRDESRLRRLAAPRASSASATPGADEITDVVCCPGTDSCKLGITSSMGLNQAVQERLEAMQITDPLTKRIHIKMSRLPERLQPAPHRQHRLLRRLDQGRRAARSPPTSPHLGGNYEGGEVVYGHRLKARLPAKRVPDAVERWLRLYEAERDDGEEFNDFVERVGTDRFEDAGQGPGAAGRVQPRDDEPVHRLEPLRALQGRARRGRVRGLMAALDSSR